MIRLLANRLGLFAFGLALLGAGILTVIEAVAAWTRNGYLWIPIGRWIADFRSTAWSADLVVGVSTGVAMLGAVLVATQLPHGRRRTVPVRVAPDTTWDVQRRSAEAHLSRQIARQVPSGTTRVRLRRRFTSWALHVKADTAPSRRAVVAEAARSGLGDLHVAGGTTVRVRTARGDGTATSSVVVTPPARRWEDR